MARLSELAKFLDALLDTPPDARAALIERLAAGDAARRAVLEKLRAQCETNSTFLTQPAAERFAALLEDSGAGYPAALGARYPLVRKVGRGGMATVYLAHDTKHGRDVAIKVMDPTIAATLGSKRFLREIEIVAQLRHPHIVPLYDSGEADGHLYYVMPYEPGASLRQKLEELGGPLPVADAVRILRDVCDAIAHAHAHGIIHRDIKPDNVLLTERHALVTDFGVAKALRDATATALAIGTPAYMAPEQIAADPLIDHRADIYAIGVLGYELLTGHPPFGGAAQAEILSAHVTEAPVPVAARRSDVPPALAALVMKCLEKSASDRWQSSAELLEQLQVLAGAAPASSRRLRWSAAAAAVALVVIAFIFWRARDPLAVWSERWSQARIERLTDFPAAEVDAAISPNGAWVAFLANRDSVFDAYAGPVASGEFVNLTAGRQPQLFNQDVRNVGFSADAAYAWIRVADITSPASVSLVPITGGPARPFLGTAVMAVWSPGGSALAYHETTPGDPIYVADRDGQQPHRLYAAEPGVHSHFLSWAPDGRSLYFAHGLPPDGMDIWRIPVTGGPPERLTHHNSRVAYPVLLDDRTLLYTATAEDGTGPWLYAMDLKQRIARRLSAGVEHYLSIAASDETPEQPRRLVATVSNPTVELWSVPIASAAVDEAGVARLSLPTARAAGPRFAPDAALFYLATRGGADGIWRRSAAGETAEVWRPSQGPVVGAPALSPDGRRMCFPVRRATRSTLYCSMADGTAPRVVAESLDVRGAASWSPDGRWVAIGAMQGTGLRVFKIPLDGGTPVRLVDSVSFNPVWSPGGEFILYSGTSRARSVPLRAVTPEGRAVALPELMVDRVGDSYRFLPGGHQIVAKLGGFRRQDLWLVDLDSGVRRRLTRLRPGDELHRFDVSPDGGHVVFERARENSDVVLIELPRR